jgi:hypothetical protein
VNTRPALAAAALLACSAGALAQNYRARPLVPGEEPVYADPADTTTEMEWTTVDAGGGRLGGGGFLLDGTVGQAEPGEMSDGPLSLAGGFWVTLHAGPACYANCDQSTAAPVLNVLDFNCFLNRFATGDPYGNCDGSTMAPALNILDFSCFLNRFAAGCP